MATMLARTQRASASCNSKRLGSSSRAAPDVPTRWIVRAGEMGTKAPKKEAPSKAPPKKEKKPWSEPTLDPETPSPIFGGSTGGLLRKAAVEEFYVVTWESSKEQIFEMPTGGAAIMRKGPNLLKLARKEQCLAVTTQLRTKFKYEPCFYRVYPDGKVEYLHPKDGVYPEKVTPGREAVNAHFRRIGENVERATIKFTGNAPYEI